MNIAVCFLTTYKHYFNLSNLKQQAKTSKLHKIDIYRYINKENINYKNVGNIIYFNYEYLREKINYKHYYTYEHHILKNNVGIQFLPLMDMYINHKNKYNIYLFYEDDLSYFGNENFFDKIDFNCNVLFQRKRTLVETDHWYWYYNNDNYKFNDSNIKKIYHGLNNIYACDNYFLDEFYNFIQNNYGYDEMILATFALNYKFKIHYINNYLKIWCSCLNHSPVTNKYNFVHPVKNIQKYKKILKKFNEKIYTY